MLAHYNLLIDNGVLGVLSKTSSEKEVVNAIRHAVKKEVVLSHQLVRQLRIVENASNINVEGEMKNIISLNDEEKMILVEVGKGKQIESLPKY